ncbi:MAG: hypothetical protein U1E65_00100 [Myxococcota bacterium]
MRGVLRTAPLLSLILAACQCGEDPDLHKDATVLLDATAGDAKPADAVAQDVEVVDLGVIEDAGFIEDAGVIEDSGVIEDAGVVDDSGVIEDAGAIEDAGVVDDSGVIEDAGVIDDSGLIDDAGTVVLDAGFADAAELDAGFPDAAEPDASPVDASALDASAVDAGPADGGPSIDFAALGWSIRAIIDPRIQVLGQAQTNFPRNARGLAMSPDGRYLYVGYLNTSSVTSEVRQIDLSLSSSTTPFINRAVGLGGKSIAVDDMGRVYIAGQERITVHTSTLGAPIFEISGLVRCEGLTVTREAGELVLYSTDRTLGTLERRVLTESGLGISAATLSGLGGLGAVTIDTLGSLRNVKVDPSGRLWVVAYAGNRVYRLDSDGSNVVSTHVEQPFDLGFDGPYVLVTHDLARDITRLDANSLAPIPPSAAPPWSALNLITDGQNHLGALTGLVVVPNVGFFVTNESGASQPVPDLVNGGFVTLDDPVFWVQP